MNNERRFEEEKILDEKALIKIGQATVVVIGLVIVMAWLIVCYKLGY